MGSRRIGAAAVAVLTGTTALAVGTTTPALADSSQQPLTITSVGDMVVDGVHERIFISDPNDGKVIATDYSGNQLGSAQVANANNLVLTPDSTQLLVNSRAESAIFALDTTTLAQTAKYSTPFAPYDMTVAGDRIWFSYGNGTRAKLGTIDPSTETPTVLLDRYDTWTAPAQLATASARPNRIGVASTSKFAILDVSGDTVTEVAAEETVTQVTDMAISPDGERIATTYPAVYGIYLHDVSDLKVGRRLATTAYSNAVDFATDGSLVGGSSLVGAPNLHLFAPSGELIKSFEPPNHGRGLDRGVAWEPNGERLFAISGNGTKLVLNAYTDTRRSPTTVTLSGPLTAVPGAPVTVTGKVTTSLSLHTGSSVEVSRDGTSLGAAAVESDGSFSFTDTPPTDGLATYQVSYAGDDTHVPSTATKSVRVARAESAMVLLGPSTALPGTPIVIPGRLASQGVDNTGNLVSVSRGGTPLGTVTVDSNSDFSFTDTPPGEGNWTYEFSYAGDDTRLPATATKSVQVARTASTMTLSGPSTALPGTQIAVSGKLTSQVPGHTGGSVSVSRAGKALGTVTVDSEDGFSFTDTPPGEGNWAYTFSYAGDGIHLPTTTTTSVKVARVASTLTLAGPSSATRAKALTITGTLASSLALSTGAKVSISRTDLEHPSGVSLGTKTVASNGAFSFTDTPTVGGTVTYRVSYAGDGTHAPVTAAKAVTVSRSSTTLTLTNGGKVYNYGQTVSFTAHLGSTYKSRTVEIWADPSGSDQAKRLIKRGTVNSAGNLVASIRLTRNTTMTAVFTGDARNAARTVTATVGTKVSLGLKLTKPYKTAKISGTTYAYYHAKSPVPLAVSMTGAANRQVYVVLEHYYKNKWQVLDHEYFDATERLMLSGDGLIGVKLRIRIAYVKGSSGDSLNTTTWTPYQYVYFTK